MPNPLDGESYEGDINAWKADNFELDGVKTEMLNGVRIHYFTSTGRAYNECQCNDAIKTGDVLVIESEYVVGLADAWPIAVTQEHGDLHALADGKSWEDVYDRDKDVVQNLTTACDIAITRGWSI